MRSSNPTSSREIVHMLSAREFAERAHLAGDSGLNDLELLRSIPKDIRVQINNHAVASVIAEMIGAAAMDPPALPGDPIVLERLWQYCRGLVRKAIQETPDGLEG